jgi:ribosomal protein L37AE/L43A
MRDHGNRPGDIRNKMTVITSKQMTGCPKCGSKRLRAAPLPVISTFVALFAKRWRYSCPSCQWSGWKRRMRRTDVISSARAEERESDKLET